MQLEKIVQLISSGDQDQIIIADPNWRSVMKQLLELNVDPNKIYVDTFRYENYYYKYVFGLNECETVDLTCINHYYNLGNSVIKEIVNSNSDKFFIISDWSAIGDTFKIASLVREFKKYYGIRQVCLITTKKFEGLSNFFDSVDEEYALDDERFRGLRYYAYISMEYWSKQYMFFGKRAFFGLNPNACTFAYAKSYFTRMKNLMGVPPESEYEQISIPKFKRIVNNNAILINPNGYWTYTNYPKLKEQFWKLFNALSRELAARGYTVYTNVTSDSPTPLECSSSFSCSVNEVIVQTPFFKHIISVMTGFAEVLALTSVPLTVIYPNKELIGRLNYSELNSRSTLYLKSFDDMCEQSLLLSILSDIH